MAGAVSAAASETAGIVAEDMEAVAKKLSGTGAEAARRLEVALEGAKECRSAVGDLCQEEVG